MASLLRRHQSKEIPELTWLASRTIAITLLVQQKPEFRQHLSQLPPHLRQSILFFACRTGLPQISGVSIDDEDLCSILCSDFVELDLSNCDVLGGVTKQGWEAVRNICPALRKLDLQQWKDRPSLISLASGHVHLTHLNISRVVGSLTTEQVIAIITTSTTGGGLPNLQNINLSHNENIDDICLSVLGKNCPLLTEINVNCCYRLTDHGMESFLENCAPLSSLGIKRCNLLTQVPFIKHANKLSSSLMNINAKGCININTECWTLILGQTMNIATSWRLGECTTSLTDVVASYESSMQGNLSSCDLSFVALDLSWQEELDQNVLCQIIQQSSSLETLKLRACESIGSNILMIAAQSCLHLKKLNVARCDRISNAAIVSMANNCPKLKDVNVSWSQCNDQGVVLLLENCLELTHLSIQGCKLITVEGISDNVIKHETLQWFDASWVNAISERVAIDICESRRDDERSLVNLEVLDYYGERNRS